MKEAILVPESGEVSVRSMRTSRPVAFLARVQRGSSPESPRSADPPLLAAGQVRRRPGRRGPPANIDQADLISYGIFGLIDAIDKFDQARGIKFETYAISRIRGAIIDELRAIDWVPRSVRAKARQVEKAYTALENKLKRPPSDAEIAEEMEITPRGAGGHLHAARRPCR